MVFERAKFPECSEFLFEVIFRQIARSPSDALAAVECGIWLITGTTYSSHSAIV